MPSSRDTGGKPRSKRSAQVLAAAEDVLPAVVRSFLRAGLATNALRDVFERTLEDCRDCAPSPDGEQRRADLDDLAHVLSVWHADPRFVDREGRPRRLRQTGRAPSFESLARLAIPSVPAPEALKRLLMVGVVEVDSRDRVRALGRELVTRHWDELGLWHWRQAARRHLETLEFNYTVPGEGRFERTAQSERVPVQLLPVFNRWVRAQGADFVHRVDDWLTQHEPQADADEVHDAITAGVGVYLFVDVSDERG